MERIGVEKMKWSAVKYTLTTLKEKRVPLPAYICVTAGYHGKDDSDTFSSDDILLLHEWRTQERILACHNATKISIPCDFENKFIVQGDSIKRNGYLVSEILEHFRPPLKVQFTEDAAVYFHKGETEVKAHTVGDFTLISSHILDYVTASTITEGAVTTTVSIPLHLKIRFVVAEGPNVNMPSRKTRFPRPLHAWNTLGVMNYTELLDTMEEYDYLRTLQPGTWQRQPNIKMQKKKHDHDNIHDRDNKKIENSFTPVDKTLKSQVERNVALQKVRHQKPTIRVQPRPMSPSRVRPPVRGGVPTVFLHGCGSSSNSAMMTSRINKPIVCKTNKPIVSPPIISTPNISRALEHRDGDMDYPVPPVPIQVHSPCHRPLNSLNEIGIAPPIKRPPIGYTGSPVPIPPRVRNREAGQMNTRIALSKSSINTMDDVPDDIGELSVEQVCICVGLLGLEDFVSNFRKAMIDGRLLKTCSIEELKEACGVTNFGARKLIMFASEGWRPKE